MNKRFCGRASVWVVVFVVIIVGAIAVFFVSDNQSYDMTAQSVEFNLSLVGRNESFVSAPGVIVLHDDSFRLIEYGRTTPTAFEELAEVGEPEKAIEWLKVQDGVIDVIETGFLAYDESFETSITGKPGQYVSVLSMVLESNDALSFVEAQPLFKTDGEPNRVDIYASEVDNGTEENSPVRSGFDGGQPDPEFGVLNLDNGVATNPQQPVRGHDQFREEIILLFGVYPK